MIVRRRRIKNKIHHPPTLARIFYLELVIMLELAKQLGHNVGMLHL